MKSIMAFLIMVLCQSCFLFNDFRRTTFSFREHEKMNTVNAVVPKRFNKSALRIDSSGNQVQYYSYPDGSILYFAFLKDSFTGIQPIQYDLNIAKPLYQTIYFKGLDSSGRYWRETRFGCYRAGYTHVEEDGKFDSAINYFSLHVRP